MVSLAAEFPNDNPALHSGASWICLEVTGAPVCVREERAPEPEILVIAAAPEPEPLAIEPVAIEPEPEAVAIEAVAVAVDPEPEPEEILEPVPVARISCVVPVGQDHHLDDDADDEAEIVVEDLPPLDEAACIVEGEIAVALAVAPEPASVEIIEPVALVEVVATTTTTLPAAPDDPVTIFLGTLTDLALAAGSPHVASVLPALLLEGRLEYAMPDDASQALAEANIARGDQLTDAFLAQMKAWQAILRGTSDDFGACGSAMLDEWAADLVARLLGAPARATVLRRDLRARGVAAFGLVEAA